MAVQCHALSIKRVMLATLALLTIARGLAPSYQSLLILDALIPIYYLQGGTHI